MARIERQFSGNKIDRDDIACIQIYLKFHNQEMPFWINNLTGLPFECIVSIKDCSGLVRGVKWYGRCECHNPLKFSRSVRLSNYPYFK